MTKEELQKIELNLSMIRGTVQQLHDIAALIAEVRRLWAIVEDYDIRPDC